MQPFENHLKIYLVMDISRQTTNLEAGKFDHT